MSTPRTIAVTGATGFIGPHLVGRLIQQGDHPLVIHRVGSDLSSLENYGDVISYLAWNDDDEALLQSLQLFSPVALVHLATHFVGRHQTADLDALIDANIRFGLHVTEAVSKLKTQTLFLNVGTIWQHADSQEYAPAALYAATKQAFADLLRFYSDHEFLRVLDLKLTDSYGPNDPRKKIFAALVRSASSGDSLPLTEGKEIIDAIYIDDLVNGLVLALELGLQQKESWSTYRLAGEALTLRELVTTFEKATGQTIKAQWGAFPSRPKDRYTPWEYGELLPGWTPRVSLDEGLRGIWDAANS